ncbi:MAG: transposase, partial [Bacteroidales bacterium]|nr:transposase [Bacteroidales bacterium]
KAMGNMLQRAKTILRNNNFTALYDKGYHTGSELKTAQDLGIEAIVAIPGVPVSSQAPDVDYNLEHFIYNQSDDTYTCPAGQILKTNGNWYKKHSHRITVITFKQYRTPACKGCPVREKCTRAKNGRIIERNQYTENYEINRKNVEQKESLYKRRQAIVEHPYGTIKRQWGFSYVSTKKGKQRASADIGFMFIAYNLRRIMNIVRKNALKKYLEVLVLSISRRYSPIRLKISLFKAINLLKKNLSSFFERFLNWLKFDQNLFEMEGF